MRTLLVTNDFPPRTGGIQTFVYELARRFPPDTLVAFAPDWPGATEFDAAQAFPVIRHSGRLVLPVPAIASRVREIAAAEGCTSAWFGAALPLALLAPRLGVERVVASTHGHEAGLARVPGVRTTLRRIGRRVDALTYLGDYTRARLAPLMSSAELVRLPPGVDTKAFHPGVDGAPVRARRGLSGRPTVICVSRLVPRKGQDTLIRALPEVIRQVPGAALLLVGGGPDMPRLQRLAASVGVADDVVFTGSVPADELPAHYAAGDVFAMPCRTRFGGTDVEGLGIVYLEASATGLPVIAGPSGGAPDAVRQGETGYVVRTPTELTTRLVELLTDPEQAGAMGRRGREWVDRDWQWDALAARLTGLLTPCTER